jgi:hypothetical protein
MTAAARRPSRRAIVTAGDPAVDARGEEFFVTFNQVEFCGGCA